MLFVVWLFGLVSVNVVGWYVVFCCVVLVNSVDIVCNTFL